MNICFSCFKEYAEEFDVCPFCGTVKETEPKEPIHLIPGTVLQDRYLLGTSVGEGGFGIVYRAWDKKLETVVAVKEFFVSHIMTRAYGERGIIVSKKSLMEYNYRKERFLAEARAMAKFGTHPNIPNVFDFFEGNDTAYIVMELLEGQALNGFLAEHGGKVEPDFALMVINEIGAALTSIHNAGIIHRDVAPDNIYLCSRKEIGVKLLDLGAAKLADSTDRFIDVILKPGYSPVEQYDKSGNIGVWTDIYALGATLYVMLTGIKPEESTNRKEQDIVMPPHLLEPSIPENISNAIMRAMAVEKHLRFKSVEEFLKAVNGEKKVISLAKEKKRRKRNRLTGIIAACLVLVIVGVVVYRTFDAKKAEQGLRDATISVWYCIEKGAEAGQEHSREEMAMQAVAEQFMSKFPNVTLQLEAIPADRYVFEIRQAAESGTLPTLFESTDVGDDVLSMATDVTNVLESEQAGNCLFIDQYDRYYRKTKKIPLGIEVPMAFVITNGNTAVPYQKPSFQELSDFGEGTGIAVDEAHRQLIDRNFKRSYYVDKSSFMNSEANTCAVMLSSSMSVNEVKETLQGYQKAFVYYDADEILCNFTYEFSIGNGSADEIAAAERLLSWMLGNVYQNTLMISQCYDGQIPINIECFHEKAKKANYTELEKIYKHFSFKK